MNEKKARCSDIARFLGVPLNGMDFEIRTAKALNAVEPGVVVFLQRPFEEAIERINSTDDVLTIVTSETRQHITGASVVVDNARLAFAKAVEHFFGRSPLIQGIAKTARIGENVQLGVGVTIGEYTVIEDNVRIGPHTNIHHHVTICEDSEIGARATLLSHSVVGEDGFGFVYDEEDEAIRFPHIGNAVLMDDVQLGCFSMVARGALASTMVDVGTKMGDYVQIAHNSRVGKHCMFAAYSKVGSGAVVEDHVFFGVRSSTRENVRVGAWAMLGQGSVVLKDVPEKAVMVGSPARILREREREGGY